MSAVITLDCTVHSRLDWQREFEQARKAAALLWQLDLGLFSGLKRGLTNAMHFQALTLALEHFRDTAWKEFQPQTKGVILYCGSPDLARGFPWDDTQEKNFDKWLRGRTATEELKSLYCTEAATEYLGLLVQRLPDAMPLEVHLDASAIQDPFLKVQLLNPVRYPRLEMQVTGGGYGIYNSATQAQLGLCLPGGERLRGPITWLEANKLFYKVIPEEDLITEWDGLDAIIFDPQSLTAQGKRKLQGFCAAGGQAITTGELIGLPEEIKFSDLQQPK